VCEKFVGKCNSSSNKKYMRTSKFDYLVSSRGGMIGAEPLSKRTSLQIGTAIIDPRKLYFPDAYYDFKINIDNRKSDFIKVISPNEILAD